MGARRRDLLRLTGALVLASGAGGALEVFREVDSPVVEIVRLPPPSPHLEGERILLISDVHSKGWGPREAFALAAAAAARPSLIALTGDLIDSGGEGIEAALRLVEGLSSIAPTFFVPGNWDYWALGRGGPPPEEWFGEISSAGAMVLRNDSVELPGGGSLVGLDDPHTWRHDVPAAFSGVEGRPLVLAHSPEAFEEAARAGAGAILAGHTHGGQVRLPLIPPIWIPARTGAKYVSGLYEVGGSVAYVSRGLGWSGLPVRFMCPPEVTLLILD